MAAALAPLKHAPFRRFLVGQTVSRVGDSVFFIALPWQIVLTGGAEAEIGFVLALFLGAQFALSLLGGALVDRMPRRRVVVLSDVFQGASVALAAVLALQGALNLAVLTAFALAWGCAQAVAFPALGAFLPETVPKSELQAANSLYQGSSVAAAIAGSVAAAVLIDAYGVWSALAFDAATFAVSAALLAGLPSPAARPPAERRRSVLAEIREGWSYVARVPWPWMGIAIFAVFNAAEASPRNVVLPVFVGVSLGGGALALGLVKATFHIGWLAGSLLPAFGLPLRRPGILSYALAAITGVLFGAIGLSTAVWQVAALLAVQGLAFGIFGVIWATAIGTYVDERMRGRVISIDTLGSIGLMPISSALVGAAAAATGPALIFIVGGVVVIGCGATGLLSRRARTFGPAPAGDPSVPSAP